MTIRHLKVFIKVCETGSVSKAAEELNIAQPSVSETIKELESFYDIILFDRVNRRLVLTKEGTLVLAKAREVVDEFNDFETLIGKGDLNPTVRVGATMSFGEFLLPNFVKTLKKEIPEVDPYIYIDKVTTLEEMVQSGELDFAIVEGITASRSLKATQIGQDRLVLVASPSFDCPDTIPATELIKYDLLLRQYDSPSRRILDYQLALKGIKITKPRLESISNNVVITMAQAGAGIGLIPITIAKKYLDDGSLKEIKTNISLSRGLYIVTLKNKKFNSVSNKAYTLCVNLLKTGF